MLFVLNFTASGITKLMYSALPKMMFFFNTVSWMELQLIGIWN